MKLVPKVVNVPFCLTAKTFPCQPFFPESVIVIVILPVVGTGAGGNAQLGHNVTNNVVAVNAVPDNLLNT